MFTILLAWIDAVYIMNFEAVYLSTFVIDLILILSIYAYKTK